MARQSGDPQDWRLAIILLRALKGWSQTELSEKARVDRGLINDYEQGLKVPQRGTRERIAAAIGVPCSYLEELVGLCRIIRITYDRATRPGQAEAPAASETDPGLAGRVADAIRETLAPFLLQWSQLERTVTHRVEDRTWAETLWSRLELLDAEDQGMIVELLVGDDRTWALAETIYAASVTAEKNNADEALRLAQLAGQLDGTDQLQKIPS